MTVPKARGGKSVSAFCTNAFIAEWRLQITMKKILLTLASLFILLWISGCVGTADPSAQTGTDADHSTDSILDSTPESIEETQTEAKMETETPEESAEAETLRNEIHYFEDFPLAETASKGIQPTITEKKTALAEAERILNDLSLLPISFRYGGTQFKGLGEAFTEKGRTVVKTDTSVSVTVVTDYDEKLRATAVITVYPDYCAYEWTVWFSNIGSENTEVLSNVNAADIVFIGESPMVQGITGDGGTGDGPYSPYCTELSSVGTANFQNETGRPNEGQNTYYQLTTENDGVFISIGWPGCWTASFEYDASTAQTHFTAGQRYLNTYLKPGEAIRTPMMSFLFYSGSDENRATNLWRHWFIDCNIRTIKGEKFQPALMSSASWKYSCMEKATDTNQCQWIRDYIKGGVNLDYFWMDAGWYYKTGTTSLTSWLESGNWNVDKSRFPSGMADISGYAAQNQCKTILWFEPEVVRLRNAELDQDGIRPEWILGVDDGNWRLADYGNDDFVEWLTKRVMSIMEEGDISIYRQDFGFSSPVSVWRKADGDKRRTGMTENKYIQGYLKFWDNLIQWNPDLMIDTCASGGNRTDLETLRRSVPLHKTDYDYSNQNEKQAMSQSLFAWIPYFGAVTTGPDASAYTVSEYDLYSSFCSAVVLDYVPNSNMNWDVMARLCQQWEGIKNYYYCDYYPLTEWSNDSTSWRGWEFFDPESDSGFLQMFRPENAASGSYRVKLGGLDPDTVYEIVDGNGTCVLSGTGSQLADHGFEIQLGAREAILLMVHAEKT